jgi:hypothetical protein
MPRRSGQGLQETKDVQEGIAPELRTLLTPQIYPDFNTLMNMAILTERARAEEKKENKRKFMEHKAKQQE